MAIDPSIALQYKGIEVPNQLGQFAQVAQIQNYQRQNELANRAVQQEDALNLAYANSIDPATGQIDANMLRKNMATGGIASKLPAAEQSIMQSRKLKNEVGKGELELGIAQADRSMRDIARYDTRADALAHIESDLAAKKISQQQAQQFTSMLPPDDAGMPKFQVAMFRQALSAKDQLEQQFTSQDYNGGTRVISTPKYGGGPAQVVQGSDIKKTATIADSLAREKFNWEKANPGYELKEAEDGSVVGVNKRTLQAFPVTMGGAAPAAGQGSPRVPVAAQQPIAQVIPGMNSVLDQRPATQPTAAPIAAAGTPFKGKGTALTETQGNATAFGMRMKESNSILENLAKTGVTRGANIEATPFIGGALGKVLPSALGGTSEAQQQLNQAKENFITANLRKESGATILDSEFEREDRKYFPQLNDGPKVLKQKADARKLAIETMMIQAGPGAKSIRDLQTSGGNSSTDPLGLMGR